MYHHSSQYMFDAISLSLTIIYNARYKTVSTLLQYYVLCPLVNKEVMLVYLINSMAQNTIIVFVRTVADAKR